ncbi:tryptophan 2,3-dioxygenase family protein [Taibaiella soli]|uniref:Tryptophan 2,3-dioxygenase n=1 Tax=Taibaiella soli TaxID=1649169 RepID=A0A2W2BDN8_9BACT|nr:tryptophan 2,3-dioxygenase family protein [Taibaiella soli]PZF71706.1 tryptophan 2,3-dioxygenase [Taibaiella soli]
MEKKERAPVYYSEYLQLQKILNAQEPESAKEGIRADDEMLFIIIHQTYELWFKQILHELSLVRDIFKQPSIPNNAPDIYNTVHRLNRVCRILEIAVSQMNVMETMTPLDFLDFRDLLRPASGFQSIQFKMIEATLGLSYDQRHGKGYYLSQLNPYDIELVKKAESEQSILVLVNQWLERMPYVQDDPYWKHNGDNNSFWDKYYEVYKNSLSEVEMANLSAFEKLFINDKDYPAERRFSAQANRSALFIMLYRDHPLLHLPYELLNTLLEVDELMAMWRYRHIHMVQRTIGKRVGTGGSTGAEYLRAAADSHYVFKELAELTSFLLPRNLLPALPEKVIKELSYN